jgi:hypothetical protein
MANTKPKPYLLIKFLNHHDGYTVEEYDTPAEALQNANFANGDIITKRLDVKVVEPNG